MPASASPHTASCAGPTSASPAASRSGTNMGVGDQVAIVIESEFIGPPTPKADAPKPDAI